MKTQILALVVALIPTLALAERPLDDEMIPTQGMPDSRSMEMEMQQLDREMLQDERARAHLKKSRRVNEVSRAPQRKKLEKISFSNLDLPGYKKRK